MAKVCPISLTLLFTFCLFESKALAQAGSLLPQRFSLSLATTLSDLKSLNQRILLRRNLQQRPPLRSVNQRAVLTTLVSFNGRNGAHPAGPVMQGKDGNFYGTTEEGGIHRFYGTLFRLSRSGSLTTLFSFAGLEGAEPQSGLIQTRDGSLWGTTARQGKNGGGTVFRFTAGQRILNLANLEGLQGSEPVAELVQGGDGNFYGTTIAGGKNDLGTIFRLTPNRQLTTLVHFNGANGARPYARLTLGLDGNFYGTTSAGGASRTCKLGCGTLFRLTATGQLTTLFSFSGRNGSTPVSPLVQGQDGSLYGTTAYGGINDQGTIFRLAPTRQLTTLIRFTRGNGATPLAGLTPDDQGNFYGTTQAGGNSSSCPGGCGTVFRLAPTGRLTRLISFNGRNGSQPFAELVQIGDGSFLGTTKFGGSHGLGTVFRFIMRR
uniref:Gloeo_Verruco repeat protein n=1 Tax=Cyanothece sp. (strain PCC 7425 / ATCC 29141) TaxID=395961 RepID=B8HUV1_CYAP4